MQRLISVLSLLLTILLFTFTGAPLDAIAQDSEKLTVDGEFDYSTAPDSPSLSDLGETITVEAWIKHDGTSDADAMILDKLDTNGNGYELFLVGSGEEVPVRFQINSGTFHPEITSESGIPADRWTHVAVTFGDGTLSLYLNGELDAQNNNSGNINDGETALYLGTTEAANERFFSGRIDEVRVWNVARSALDIKENQFASLSGTETGLVAYYPFDGGAPTSDQSENGNDLTLEGDAVTGTPDVLPVPPDLYVENEGAGQVSLRWEERIGINGGNEADGFELYRSPPSGLGDRSLVETFDASTTSHIATGLANGETYFWEITSTNETESGESDYSSFVTGTPHDGSESDPLRGGASLALDGDLDYGEVGDRPSLSDLGETITVEAWIKHDGTSDADARILDKRDTNNSGYELFLVGSGEEVPVQFQIDAFTEITSESGIPADRWTHVAVTFGDGTLSLYLNGELDAQKSDSENIDDGETALYLGTMETANGQFFSGRIDEVRVWNVARTQSEIQSHYQQELVGSEDGLLAYWRFNDARKEVMQGQSTGFTRRHADLQLQGDAALSGPGVFPLAPRAFAQAGDATVDVTWTERKSGEADQYRVYRATGFDGSGRTELATQGASNTSYTDDQASNSTNYFYEVTTINAQGQESDFDTPVPVTPSEDPFGNALTLDGDQDYGTVGDQPSTSVTGGTITVEARIKHDGTSDADAMILDKRDTNDNGYELFLVGSGEEVPVRFQINGGTFHPEITSESGIPADQWTHVAVTFGDGTLSLYLNGELDAQNNNSGNINDGETALYLGTTEATNVQFFSGRIDDVRIWTTARTQSEIQSTYNQELIGNESDLVAYWRFNEVPGTPVSRAAAGRPKTVDLQGDADLPVELAGFDATVDNGEAQLSWTTASETNNAGFRVQRKGARERGSESAWTTVGSVEGSGTTSQAQSYRFTDANLPYEADALTYRLKQVDTDGSAHVSDPVTVERSVDEVELLGTYPNPASQQATVRYALPEQQDVTVRLYDVLGRRVQTVAEGEQEGRQKRRVDLSGLSSGVYFLRLRAGEEVRSRQVTVVH